MTKNELLNKLPWCRRRGYITHETILELFSDDEEIPRDFINLIVHKPLPQRQMVIIMSYEQAVEFDNAIKEYIKHNVIK